MFRKAASAARSTSRRASRSTCEPFTAYASLEGAYTEPAKNDPYATALLSWQGHRTTGRFPAGRGIYQERHIRRDGFEILGYAPMQRHRHTDPNAYPDADQLGAVSAGPHPQGRQFRRPVQARPTSWNSTSTASCRSSTPRTPTRASWRTRSAPSPTADRSPMVLAGGPVLPARSSLSRRHSGFRLLLRLVPSAGQDHQPQSRSGHEVHASTDSWTLHLDFG